MNLPQYHTTIHAAIAKLSEACDYSDPFFYAEQRRTIPGLGERFVVEIRCGHVRGGNSMPVFFDDGEQAMSAIGQTIDDAQRALLAKLEGFVG